MDYNSGIDYAKQEGIEEREKRTEKEKEKNYKKLKLQNL